MKLNSDKIQPETTDKRLTSKMSGEDCRLRSLSSEPSRENSTTDSFPRWDGSGCCGRTWSFQIHHIGATIQRDFWGKQSSSQIPDIIHPVPYGKQLPTSVTTVAFSRKSVSSIYEVDALKKKQEMNAHSISGSLAAQNVRKWQWKNWHLLFERTVTALMSLLWITSTCIESVISCSILRGLDFARLLFRMCQGLCLGPLVCDVPWQGRKIRVDPSRKCSTLEVNFALFSELSSECACDVQMARVMMKLREGICRCH